MHILEQRAGAAAFSEVHAALSQRVRGAQEERKRKAALQAVVAPDEAAAAKLEKNLKKRVWKKQKVEGRNAHKGGSNASIRKRVLKKRPHADIF
jgi:hypothetical protein